MYKVQTNQVNVPLSRLQLRSSPTVTQPSTPAAFNSTVGTASPSKPCNPSIGSASLGSPLQVAGSASSRNVREAIGTDVETPRRPIPKDPLKLLPGPILKPTAFSSRFTGVSPASSTEPGTCKDHAHDGYPSSISEGSTTEIASLASPSGESAQEEQLTLVSAPPETANQMGHASSSFGTDIEMTDGEGTAANGLLELMHASASYSASK